MLIANAFWRNIFVLLPLIANPAWGPDHNRLQFYFLKCWHLSKCSHGMFVWFVDWHFLFVTCLTKKETSRRPNFTVPAGSRPLLAAAACVWFLFYFPLSLLPPSPCLSLYFDMHIILADFYHLIGVDDIPSKIKLSHLGFVQKFSVL